jgi:hypothetical protein
MVPPSFGLNQLSIARLVHTKLATGLYHPNNFEEKNYFLFSFNKMAAIHAGRH